MEQARQAGFELCGIARVEEFPRLRHFVDWIAAGRAGEMHYLERRTEPDGATGAEPSADSALPPLLREDVRHVFPWARSIICCGIVYNAPAPRSVECHDAERGWISRYAWGDDYHETVKQRLRQLAAAIEEAWADSADDEPAPEFRVTVDTAPIVERVVAEAAGLGWQGKNTCLIHPQIGSWFFLGTIATSLEIEPDSPLPDRCGSCTRCIEACPTQALEPYSMDARRCLAYLNIELRGAIPEEFRPAMGDNVYGCDICQDVCPWNRKAAIRLTPEFQPRAGLVHPRLADLATLGIEGYRRQFRHSAVKRAKYQGLLRNVAVAMGNSGNAGFRPILEQLAAGDDPVVAEHAGWALARLPEVSDESAADGETHPA